jgi:hypothetical protein
VLVPRKCSKLLISFEKQKEVISEFFQLPEVKEKKKKTPPDS